MNRKDTFKRIFDFIYDNSSYYDSIRDDLKELENKLNNWNTIKILH